MSQRRKLIVDEEYFLTLQDFRMVLEMHRDEFFDEYIDSQTETVNGEKTLTHLGNIVATARNVLKKHDELKKQDLHIVEELK